MYKNNLCVSDKENYSNILYFIIFTKESIEYGWNILVYRDTPNLVKMDNKNCRRLILFDTPIKMYLFILDILLVSYYYI